MLVFDEQNLLRVAALVKRYNKHAAHLSTEALIEEMKLEARALDNSDLGYIGTRGYILSAYHIAPGKIGVKGSLADYIFD